MKLRDPRGRVTRRPTPGICQPRSSRLVSSNNGYGPTSPSSGPPQSRPRSSVGWVAAIHQTWARGSANTQELAQIVSDAKEDLAHGEWTGLFRSKRLPFSIRKGEMLALIGATLGNLNPQNSAGLPLAWNTLYFLARLGRSTVEQLLSQGRIRPGTTLKQAKRLLAEFQPETIQINSRPLVEQRFSRFAAFISKTLANWSEEQLAFATSESRRLAEKISRAAAHVAVCRKSFEQMKT